MVVEQNKTIPLLLTTGKDTIIATSNLDSNKYKTNNKYFLDMLVEFRGMHRPIEFDYGYGKQYVYYGESHSAHTVKILSFMRAIIMLFLVVVLLALTSLHRSMQNHRYGWAI